MTEEQLKILKIKVKRKCYITDESELIENRINDIIEDANFKLLELLGIANKNFDFSSSGQECELFKSYCFYMWNDKSIKEFEEEYLPDILKIRHKNLLEEDFLEEDNE